MLKIVRIIFLIALMIMSFFAGVILNNPKLKDNCKSNNELIAEKKEKILIINDMEITEINKNRKKDIIEEDAPKINESEIEDNDKSIEIKDNIQNNEESRNNTINNNVEDTMENDKNNDGYTKKNEVIPVAISK